MPINNSFFVDTTTFQKTDFKNNSLSKSKMLQTSVSSKVNHKKDTISEIQSMDITFQDSVHVKDNSLIILEKIDVLPKGEMGKSIGKQENSWVIGILVLALIIMAIIRFSFPKYLNKVVNSIFNLQTSNKLFAEKNMRNLRGAIFMNALFFLNGAVFMSLYADNIMNVTPPFSKLIFFLYCFATLTLLYLGKTIILKTFGYIFNASKESNEYIHNIFIYNKNLGMLLLPIVTGASFMVQYAVPLLLNTGLFIALIFFIFRIARGIKILFRKHVSIIYMILYLCALEILPLLMIYKLLKLLA